jgi:hypothetical protein
MAQAGAIRDRFIAAIEKSDPHFGKAGGALTGARTITSWLAAASAFGAVAALSELPLCLLFGFTLVLSILARVRIVDGLQDLQRARHQGRDLGDPTQFSSGEIITLRAGWTIALGDEEPVVAEIVDDDGRDGAARILCEPLGGALIIPNTSVMIVARKGDLVRYTREGGSYPSIWGLAGPASPISV